MASWDVFHADRLELQRGLDEAAIRLAFARAELRDDDLVRPAGSALAWARLADFPELTAPPEPAKPPETVQEAPLARPKSGTRSALAPSDLEELQPSIEEVIPPPKTHERTLLPNPSSSSDVTFPVIEIRGKRAGPADQGLAVTGAQASGWVWADEDESSDEGDEDDQKRDAASTEESDLEILADEAELDDLPKSSQRPAPAPAPPTRQSSSTTSPLERWEAGPDDLDWNARRDTEPSHVALTVARAPNRESELTAAEPTEQPEAVFSLSRSATEKIEELDLAPMVDVAFNLVLFFMVTATTVLYKTLEIPKPSGEAPASAVAQGRPRSLDDLKKDYILVEIDESGRMKLDREPVEPTMSTLVESLRKARERTGRTAMLLSADFATPHRNSVLAYDAANEIGLGIAIARPQPPQGPAPTLRPAAEAPAVREAPAAPTF